MVKIGNIVTFNKSKVGLTQFNIYHSLEEVQNGLPTLLIGYDDTKTVCKTLDFTNRKITNNLFWTTSRIEDRYLFGQDLEEFIVFCEKQMTESFHYFFVNPFELNLKQVKRLVKKIKFSKGSYYQDREMIYVFVNGFTYGYHRELGDIFGIPKERVAKFLNKNGYIKINDTEVDNIKKALEIIDYDQSQLLFLKEKFLSI